MDPKIVIGEDKTDFKVDESVNLVFTSKSILAVTGAGISDTIPNIKVEDIYGLPYHVLHSASIMYAPNKYNMSQWLKGHASFMRVSDNAMPSLFHHWASMMASKKYLKGYITQNIDGLERKLFLDKKLNSMFTAIHGDYLTAICWFCNSHDTFITEGTKQLWANGVIVPCPKCQATNYRRERRAQKQGIHL